MRQFSGRLIFSAFADFERDLIVERTQEGKELAKQKPDFREGRPKKFNQQQINLAMNLLKNHSYKEVEKMTGISKSTLTRNKRIMQLSAEGQRQSENRIMIVSKRKGTARSYLHRMEAAPRYSKKRFQPPQLVIGTFFHSFQLGMPQPNQENCNKTINESPFQ